ncbi:MAG: AMP-binding protein [Acidobacteria bacterium]|nr:AMP-binding protein [Acidobacteriota bacterium]
MVSHQNMEHDLLFVEIAKFAVEAPRRTALLEPGGHAFSYIQLWTMCEALRQLLKSEGIQSHETVAVVLPDALCGLISTLGISRICACAPINPAVSAPELERDLLELGAVAIVIEHENEAFSAMGEKLGLLVIVSTVTEDRCSWRVKTKMVESKRSPIQLPACTTLLLHTSATTGRRKIVPLTNGNLDAMFRNTSHALHLTSDDRLLLMAKLFHIQGIIGAWAQLRAGGCVITGLEYTPQSFQQCLLTYRPTWYTGGPTLHRAIVSNLNSYPIPKPTSLRFVRSGGAILPAELADALEDSLGVPVLDVYGLTEVGGIASTPLGSPRVTGTSTSRPVGPSTGPEIAVMHSDGTLLGTSQEGQIVVRGPNVMPGYVNDQDANRDAYRDGWFLTGDLGRIDDAGFLWITGRIKEMINRGGQKLIPDEVDAVLIAHEAIREVATFAVAHPSLGEDVACAIVVREGSRVDDEELREFAAMKLSTYKLPRRIYRLNAIPRGATGKPQRLVLRERFSNSVDFSHSSLEPAPAEAVIPQRSLKDGPPVVVKPGIPTDLMECLLSIWRRCLRTEQIGIHDDFFEIGGDSINAATMLAEVESIFSLPSKLSDSQFFRNPTLTTLYKLATEAMAGCASKPASSKMELIPVVTHNGPNIALYMIPSDGAEGFSFRELGRQLKPAWSLDLLRPGSLWHEHSADSIQVAGKQAAALVIERSHQCLCVIGGFCYGGVVAFETARALEQRGRSCLLLLFDVPTPGFPRLIQDGPAILKAIAKTVTSSLRAGKMRPILSIVRRLMRRVLWLAFRSMQRRGTSWKKQPMRWLSEQSRAGYFSFISPTTISSPILHIMATDAQDPLLESSRHAWRLFAGGGIRTIVIPGEHDTMFRQSNVPLIVQNIAEWLPHQKP